MNHLYILENRLKQQIDTLPVLKEHEIFIDIFEQTARHCQDKPTAYEKAEDIFKTLTQKGFDEPLRKYDYAEVFFTIYSRHKKKSYGK